MNHFSWAQLLYSPLLLSTRMHFLTNVVQFKEKQRAFPAVEDLLLRGITTNFFTSSVKFSYIYRELHVRLFEMVCVGIL